MLQVDLELYFQPSETAFEKFDCQRAFSKIALWRRCGHKKRFKFYLITALHGLEVTRLNSKKYIKRKKNFINTLDLSDKVVSVSNYTKKEALKIIKNKKIEVIPNFVNTQEFFPIDRSKLMKEYNLIKEDKIILSLSRLVKRKGHHIVIKSLKYLKKEIPNFKYLIAGTGDLKYKKDLENLSKELNLEENIIFQAIQMRV